MLSCNKFVNSNKYNNNVTFKNVSAFNTVANIESNILLNKGITDLGGFVIPQAIMSNNRDESIERVFKSALYFLMTFVSPFVLLPLINKKALSHYNITKSFNNNEKRILEVSKKYLTKDKEYLEKGIKEKSKELFGTEDGFNSVLERYQNDTEKLRKDLINAHTTVHFTDFLTTNLMVASIPWLGNLLTKYRTNRSGYSGTYKMADEDFTKIAAHKHDKTKKLRQAATLTLAILPSLILPPLIKKGMKSGTNSSNKLIKWFNQNADKFDYKNAIYMSRLTALTMWLTSDYFPYQLACRDKYEYRDCLIRGTSIGLIFWGGDLLLKRLFAKGSDKIFKTNIMDKTNNKPFTISELKNYKNIDALKNLSEKTIKKTQRASVGLYVLNLATIMGILGFGLPAFLNKILKKSVEKDKNNL
ncbi:MAG: hypothetical protein MJ237_09150 [bacterium]|nr:hypothetical protein [bacterium]